MGGKHEPIALGRYLEIHTTAMRTLAEKGYVLPDGDGLAIGRTDRGLLIEGRIQCAGAVILDVEKFVAVLRGSGEGAEVQTQSYSYHAQVTDMGKLFRYCSPHIDHNRFHHKHVFDPLGATGEYCIKLDPDVRPTLAEAISEAAEWYFHNAEAIERRRVIGA